MEKQTIIIVLVIIAIISYINLPGKMNTPQTIGGQCIDNPDIWSKESCNDGAIYTDMCRIDDGPLLYEFKCTLNDKCDAEIIDCSKYGGTCNNGKCTKVP